VIGGEQCANCGGYPPIGHRLVLARPKSGDLYFCGYQQCFKPWAERQPVPTPAPVGADGVRWQPVPPSTPKPVAPEPTWDRCQSCDEVIVWGETTGGRRAPFNVSDDQNHFVTCPQRREWVKADAPAERLKAEPVVQAAFSLFDEEPAVVVRPSARPWDA
jgi:hypothetical protein